MGFGIWDLGFWDLGFGIWDLVLGFAALGLNPQTQILRPGVLGFGIWDLVLGFAHLTAVGLYPYLTEPAHRRTQLEGEG